MKTISEVYIVKEDYFTTYKIKNEVLANQNWHCNGFYSPTHNTIGLKVYVNDNELVPNCDYTIFDGELNFLNPISLCDKIIIKDSILDSVKLFSKNSYSKKSLFKYYSSDVKLKNNQIYKFTLTVKDEEHNIEFLSKYDPLYTTVDKIRLDTGDLLNNVTDAQIAKVIYLNSKETLEKIETSIENGSLDESVKDKIPTFVKNYVRYKTDIDFCYAIYLSISGKYGSHSKKVGDISIENTVKLPYINEMIGRFKELLKPNEEAFKSSSAIISASFVKAGNSNSYPVDRTVVF